jgi:iron complex outermembrane receptor protein
MSQFRKTLTGALLFSSVTAGFGGAFAQAPVATTTSDDIVITAERRTESLQKTPISATVLNADLLADRGVDNIAEVQQVAPSLAINTYNRSTFINIRGVGIAQSAPTSNPGVATYVDSVLLPHEQMIGQSFYDLNSIEVLRGPQGTLTGQNSTGGAVYITTPAPVMGAWSGYLDQTFGDYNAHRTVGALNAPLGDKIALRAAAVYDVRDSFTDNIGGSGRQPGNVDLFAYRVSALFEPIDALQIKLHYSRYLNDTDYNAIKNRNDVVSSDPFVIEENGPSDFYQKGYVASAEADYDFSNATLKWVSSYQDGFTQDISDGDRTAAATNKLSYGKTIFRTQTHELNLISNNDGPVDWVAGLFYLDEQIPVTLLRWNNATNLAAALLTTPNSTIITEADNTTKSVFGQIGWKFAPDWKVSVGGRYSEDQQVYKKIATPGPPGPTKPTGVQKSNEPTGRIALNWTPQDDVLYYLSLSKGYKAGGVNLGPTDPNFQPEQNYVAELGMKRSFFDSRVRFSGDVFYSDYKDIQFASLIGAPPLPVTQNAAGAKTYGAELEANGRFDDLSFNLGVGYLHARFDGDSCLQNTNPVPAFPACATGQVVADGAQFPFAPEWTINAGAEYDFHIAGMTLTPRVQYAHLSEQLATPFPSAATIVPSRDVWDAKVTLAPASAVQLEAFVTNFTDETYIAAQVQDSSSATGGIIYGAPRQVGVRLKAKF